MTRLPERKEITFSEINDYFITAGWGPRAETPAELAKRFFSMIDAFKRVDPVFSHWLYGRSAELETLRDDFSEDIAKNMQRDDFGDLIPGAGFSFHARTQGQPLGRCFSVFCRVGKSLSGPIGNNVILSDEALVQAAPEMHSYRVVHSALLAVVDAWEPDTVEANCNWLVRRKKYDFPFRPAWMRYLCPALTRQAKPSASALTEHLPNGGLLLSATKETFDVDNPKHVAAAEEIAAALASLDRIQRPSKA